MYRHIVMFWLKDRSDANIILARDKLRSLAGRIEGLLSVEVERDALGSERSCDLCLNMLFDSRASLDAYRTHPAHLPVQRHMHAVREKSCAADYPVETPVRQMPRLYAFLGPASAEEAVLGALLDAGMTGVRLGLRHETCDEAMPMLEALARAAALRGVTPEVLLDDVPEGQLSACLARTGATGLIVPAQALASLPEGRHGVRVLAKVDCEADLAMLPALFSGADELIIARSGMGRNLTQHGVPRAQKQVAAICRAAGHPFMLAAELLTTMLRSPFPATAELCDIHNAVHDGASALMLTREVALGDYPVLAMETLRRAAEEAVRS